MRWDSTPFGEENPRAYAFTARAWGNGEGPGQEFCFVKIHVSSATYTVSSSSQVEETSGQLSNAPKPSVCKVPEAQSYLDGGGAQARQCGFPRCAAACNAAAASAATSCGQGPVVPTRDK